MSGNEVWTNGTPVPLAELQAIQEQARECGVPIDRNFRVYPWRDPGKTVVSSRWFEAWVIGERLKREVAITTAVPHGLKDGDTFVVNPEPKRKRPDPAKELRRLKAGRRK